MGDRNKVQARRKKESSLSPLCEKRWRRLVAERIYLAAGAEKTPEYAGPGK